MPKPGSAHQWPWARRKVIFTAHGKVGDAEKSHTKQESHQQTEKEEFSPVPRPLLEPAPDGDLAGLSLQLIPHTSHPATGSFSSPLLRRLLSLPFSWTANAHSLVNILEALATCYLQRSFRASTQKRPNETPFICSFSTSSLSFPLPLFFLVACFETGTHASQADLELTM